MDFVKFDGPPGGLSQSKYHYNNYIRDHSFIQFYGNIHGQTKVLYF